MVADTKKEQSLINAAVECAEQIAVAVDKLEALRTAYRTQGVDPTGIALEGNAAAVSGWIDSIRAVADSPITTGMITARVATHRGKALD